jgi:hypothetical protein
VLPASDCQLTVRGVPDVNTSEFSAIVVESAKALPAIRWQLLQWHA